MSTNVINIAELLNRPVWQMTGAEYCELTRYATSASGTVASPSPQAVGIQALAKELGCSASTLYAIKKYGALNDAIISRIGRKEVFDIEKARTLANDYQTRQRAERRSKV